MSFLLILLGIINIVCFIWILISMFKAESNRIWLPIISIFCGIIALVWAWTNKDKVNTKVLYIWTAVLILNIILNAMFGPSTSELQPEV